MTRVWAVFAAAVAAFVLASVANAAVMTCANTVRVSVLKDGSILIDETKGDLGELNRRFDGLAQAHGAVWYYREASNASPTPEAKSAISGVIGAIINHKLPISFSSKADFSDVVDDKGQSSPRPKC